MKLIALSAIAASLALHTGAAAEPLPAGVTRAHLATAVPQPVEKLIDGRFWSCEAQVCGANPQNGSDSQPLWMECGHAAAAFGAFTDYQTGAGVLEPAKLVRCNAWAKSRPHG